MKGLKLIKILRTLKPEELKDFEKFIVSPYFNKGRNLLPYFKELKKFGPEFDSPDLTKEYLFSRLNKGSRFDNKASALMNKLNSDMQKLLESFLITSETETNPITRGILLNEKYLKKGLHKLSLHELLKLKEIVYGSGINDNYYLPKQKLLSLIAETYIGTGRMKDFHKTYEEFSDQILMTMLIYYFEDYAHRTDFEIGSNVKQEPSHISKILSGFNFEEIIESISQKNSSNGIILNIYFNLYKCYKNFMDYEQFNRFKFLVFKNLNYFPHEEKFNLLNYIITLCTISGRLGYGSRAEDQLETYEVMIKNKILSFREYEIHHTTFLGINSMFITFKKYRESENFIEEFSDWLPVELRERYKYMAIARINFSKKEYGKVLEIISSLPELALNNINAVQLKAISLFELGEYDTAEATLESFKKYLKNNKRISKANGCHYLGFAEGLRLLIKSVTGSLEAEPVRKMQQIFKKYPTTFRKEWLLKKAEELESAGAGTRHGSIIT